MRTYLPVISAAGLFDSREKFSDPKRYHDNAVTRLRTVVDYELELFTQDGGTSHLNGNSYPIKKGDILLACPGDKRQSTLHFTAIYVHFGTKDEAIKKLISLINGYHTDMGYEKFRPYLSDICETALSFENDSDLDASAKLISFLCLLKKNCLMHSNMSDSGASYSVVSSAIEYMKQYYMEPLTVGTIAEHCCLSSSYFYKIFYETTCTTPNNYLTRLRLSAAKSLLVSTTLPISEIAVKCGFNSQAYFSDCFKRQFDTTPREFRRTFLYPDHDA